MYPISSDILAIFQSGAMQYARLTIGTAGQTGYQLIENDRIKQGGFNVNRFAETDDTVKIGSCSAAELTVVLDNRDGVYDDYDFIGKEAKVEVGVDDDGTITYVPFGYFTFDEAGYDKSALRLAALDRMLFFERTIDASQLSFPYTITQLLTRICTVCGVPLGNIQTLLNGGISVPSLPKDAKTYRDLLVWIAEISGNVAYINYDGELMLGWYQGSQFTLTTANRKNSTLERGTVLVTGVEVVVGENTTLQGTSARTIRVENNPLIPSGQESFIATGLFNKVGGFSYTPFSATVLPMPHIEPLDGCTFVTEDNESVFVPITDWSFNLNGSCSLAGKSNQATYRRGYGLADAILQSTNLADKAVTTAKIADNAVDTAQLAALAVKEGKIAANAVTEGKIAANAVVADKIASNAVTTDKLNALAVTAGKIASGAVTADKISVTDLSALQATIGGWDISSDMLYKTITSNGYEYQIAMYAPQNANAGNAAFFVRRRPAGSTGDYTMLWYVAYGGKTYAKDAEVEGKITATSGKIGGWEIDTNALKKTYGANGGVWLNAPASPSGSNSAFHAQDIYGENNLYLNYDGSLESAFHLAGVEDDAVKVDDGEIVLERKYYKTAGDTTSEKRRGEAQIYGSEIEVVNSKRDNTETRDEPLYKADMGAFPTNASFGVEAHNSNVDNHIWGVVSDSNAYIEVAKGNDAVTITNAKAEFVENGKLTRVFTGGVYAEKSTHKAYFNPHIIQTKTTEGLEDTQIKPANIRETTQTGTTGNYTWSQSRLVGQFASCEHKVYVNSSVSEAYRTEQSAGHFDVYENDIKKSAHNALGIITYDSSGNEKSRLTNTALKVNGHDIIRMTPHFAQMFATEIPANANLNTTTYLKVGQYYVGVYSTAITISNLPQADVFTMTVEAPITSTYDDESTTSYGRYRIRTLKYTNGNMWVQVCSAANGSSAWTYGAWQLYVTGYKAGNLQINTSGASFAEAYCKQYGKTVNVRAWLTGLSTSTQSHADIITVQLVDMPTTPVRFVFTCWLGNGIAAYAGYGVMDTYGRITLVKAVANSDKASFEFTYNV